MSLDGHRRQRYLVEHLTKSEASLGYLDGVTGGRLAWNANATVPGAGELQLQDLRKWYTEWTTQRINQVLDPQATSATYMTQASQGGSITYGVPADGGLTALGLSTYSRIQWVGISPTSSPASLGTASANGRRFAVTELTDYVFSTIHWRSFALTGGVRIDVTWYDAANVNIGSSSGPLDNSAPLSTWVRQSRSVQSPAGAVTGRMVVSFSGTGPTAGTNGEVRVTGLQVEPGTVSSSYMDGSTPSVGSLTRFRWLGTPNASPSVREVRSTTDIPGAELASGPDVDYSKDRVRIWWEVDGEDPWPMGVYVLAAPISVYSEAETSRALTLIDKLTVVRDDVLTTTLQVPAGSNLVDAAVAQVYATGETRVSVTSSTAVSTNAMTWGPGTSRLQVVNDLLTAANYWGLWTDRRGQFCFTPYLTPANRPVSWVFEEGESAIHSPDWEYELALWEATNTVVLISQENAGVVWSASAVDDNPASPTSTISMGRVLNPIVEENVEASSQADLQVQASRKLIDNSNVVGKIRVSHAPVPVWYNEAVRFKSQGTDTLTTITTMGLELTPGALMTGEWRQVR